MRLCEHRYGRPRRRCLLASRPEEDRGFAFWCRRVGDKRTTTLDYLDTQVRLVEDILAPSSSVLRGGKREQIETVQSIIGRRWRHQRVYSSLRLPGLAERDFSPARTDCADQRPRCPRSPGVARSATRFGPIALTFVARGRRLSFCRDWDQSCQYDRKLRTRSWSRRCRRMRPFSEPANCLTIASRAMEVECWGAFLGDPMHRHRRGPRGRTMGPLTPADITSLVSAIVQGRTISRVSVLFSA